MRRPCVILIACASIAAAAAQGSGFRLDLSGFVTFPLTWYEGGPTLPHFGGGGGLGLEYDLVSWVPGRIELSGFGVGQSAVSSGGEIYRAWQGFRIAALAGYRFQPWASLWSCRLGLFGGGALTAAGYTGTNLAFAYPSALAELRLDFFSGKNSSFWMGLPLEYMFRGAFASASAGLSAGWRIGPLPLRSTSAPRSVR
jgi:hypothetical protein